MGDSPGFIPTDGHYKQLLSYQKAEVISRASLEELLADYNDFLRVRALPRWTEDSHEAVFVRRLGNRRDAS